MYMHQSEQLDSNALPGIKSSSSGTAIEYNSFSDDVGVSWVIERIFRQDL